ncbi:MAG: histidinol dehydrogenase, partial [Xanthobacteraceae bacterium]
MPIRLDTSAADFTARFKALLRTKREVSEDVSEVVRGIIADVMARGDRALFELTRRFDKFDPESLGLMV